MGNIATAQGKNKAVMPWFRMYSEFATDPKVQMLSEVDQRRFVMLLCLRCSNGDVTLHDDEIAFQLRIGSEEWAETKRRLQAKNLIDDDNLPTAWDKRQYRTDSSRDRVAKHRAKKRASGLNGQVWISNSLRAEVYTRDGNCCVYCQSNDDLTIDHKVPPIRGGDEKVATNLQTCCRSCNADKRNMTHDEYLAWPGRVTLLKRPQRTDTDTDTERVKQLTDIPERSARDVGLSDPPDDLKAAFNGSTDALLELVTTHLGNDRRAAEHWLGNLLAQCGATAVLGAYQQLLTAKGTNQPIARPIQYLSKTAASLKAQPTPAKAEVPRRRFGQPVPIAIPKASPEEIARTMRVLQADWSIPEH